MKNSLGNVHKTSSGQAPAPVSTPTARATTKPDFTLEASQRKSRSSPATLPLLQVADLFEFVKGAQTSRSGRISFRHLRAIRPARPDHFDDRSSAPQIPDPLQSAAGE